MSGHNKLSGLALFLFLSVPFPAFAQHNASPDPPKPGTTAPNGQNPLQRANDLSNQANSLSQSGRYSEAIPLAEAALDLYREQLGANHPDVALSLNNLGLMYQNQGLYREAESVHLEALGIRQRLGDAPVDVAISLNNLAEVYRLQGRYGEAEPLYLESLEIARQQLGNDHPNVTFGLNNLGLLYQTQGRYGEAEPLYLESLAIRRQQLGNTHPAVSISLNNLAELYRVQGRYEQAEPLYLESLTIVRQQLGNNHPQVAFRLNNLAALYRVQERYEQAESLYEEALTIFRQQLGDNHPAVARSLNNLAALYQVQGRYDEAARLYQEALTIVRQQLGNDHPAIAISLSNLADLYRLQGRYDEAEPRIQEALAIARRQLGERHPGVALSLNTLAALRWSQGQPTQAIAIQRQAAAIEEFNLDLNLATLAEEQRQDYVATLADTTDAVFSLHLQGAIDNREAAELAVTTLLRRKGRILDAGVDSLQRLRQNLNPSDQQRLDELTDTRQQLATLTFNPTTNLNHAALERLETEINQLEADLARRSNVFRAEAAPVELATVQAQIPANGVLVEYIRYRPFDPRASEDLWGAPRYAVYLLFANGDIKATDLGAVTEIDAAVQAFSLSLRNPAQSTTAASRALAEKIFDPIQPYLTGREHLLISPDSQLNRIPFEALQNEAEDYLLQQFQISYLNSGRDLLKFDLTEPSQQPALIVANPDYALADTSIQIASTRHSQRSAELGQLQVGPLPGTAAEAAAISPLFPNATVLTEADATENALKQVQFPAILHIATHGFFLTNVVQPRANNSRGLGVVASASTTRSASITVENPLLRSGLALAGFNERDSGDEDGVLTALEAAQLNLLGTQLVVLSACDTGLGDIANGEGVYGLRRAFAIAGAETQLMSLWQVDDFGTQSLMTRYYENLTAGMGRSEALRQVQLDMLNSGVPYSHPFYWAAFITTGDWRPLE